MNQPKATTKDEFEAAAEYVDGMNARMAKKLAEISTHQEAISILRKEIRKDRRARNSVADRHGIPVSDA